MDLIIGRYAPSPTGALHLGNLRTAIAAWADVRSRGGRFFFRIDDLDPARSREEFITSQQADLIALGIDWDEKPVRQSERSEAYQEALCRLQHQRLAYPCFCSRKEISEAVSAPHGASLRYPGTCASLPLSNSSERIKAGEQHCWRLRIQGSPKTFFDGFMGEVATDLDVDGGDFVIRRADGIDGYQLACAIDDAASGITTVLRGSDLLISAARQAWILASLQLPVPRYVHLPLLRREDGERLSKRAGAEAFASLRRRGISAKGIFSFLAWTLGQAEYGERVTRDQLLDRWDLRRVPRQDFLFADEMLASYVDETSPEAHT